METKISYISVQDNNFSDHCQGNSIDKTNFNLKFGQKATHRSRCNASSTYSPERLMSELSAVTAKPHKVTINGAARLSVFR